MCSIRLSAIPMQPLAGRPRRDMARSMEKYLRVQRSSFMARPPLEVQAPGLSPAMIRFWKALQISSFAIGAIAFIFMAGCDLT